MKDDDKRKWFDAVVWTVSLLFTGLLIGEAHAGGHRYTVDNAAYRNECGSCHIAYPPALLGADGWRDIMRGLDRHFGTDASVSEPARTEIGSYLDGAASARPKHAAAALRISDTPWFRKEHDEVPSATWKKPAVKSAANCGACHRQADRGDFSERNLRVPRQEPR